MTDPGALTDPVELPPASPASTVVVVRDGSAGLEVLLLERSTVGAFAGLWVFPGGRVDDADEGADELERARSAAAREAAEEANIVLSPADLVPWSHWTPPPVTPKRFATWFFVAPWDGGEVRVDDHEIVSYGWFTPSIALDGRLPIAPPTAVTLHQLADRASVAEALEHGPSNGVERFVTKSSVTRSPVGDDEIVLLWHGDAGYEHADPSLGGPRHRATMAKGRFATYERSTNPQRLG